MSRTSKSLSLNEDFHVFALIPSGETQWVDELVNGGQRETNHAFGTLLKNDNPASDTIL